MFLSVKTQYLDKITRMLKIVIKKEMRKKTDKKESKKQK
jgi:hypothetical protein